MRYFRSSLVLTGIAAALAAFPTHAQAADDLAAVYARIDKAAPAFSGFAADIRRAKHTALIPEDDVDAGTVLVRRPKPHELQVRIDFAPPNQKEVVLDGSKVEIYYPKTNTIQPVEMGKYKAMAYQLLMLGMGTTSAELQRAYDIKYLGQESVAGQKAAWLSLIPKDKDLLGSVPRFELWISEEAATSGTSLQVKVYEKGGDFNLATYSNVQLRAVPESDVKMKAPKNAQREKTIK